MVNETLQWSNSQCQRLTVAFLIEFTESITTECKRLCHSEVQAAPTSLACHYCLVKQWLWPSPPSLIHTAQRQWNWLVACFQGTPWTDKRQYKQWLYFSFCFFFHLLLLCICLHGVSLRVPQCTPQIEVARLMQQVPTEPLHWPASFFVLFCFYLSVLIQQLYLVMRFFIRPQFKKFLVRLL